MKEFTQYLQSLEDGNRSFNTTRLYKKDIERFLSYFEILNLNDLKKISVSDISEFYRNTGLKGNSLNSLIRSMLAFFNWLKKSTFIKDHAVFHVLFGNSKFIKVPNRKKPILTDEEQRVMISAADNCQERFMLMFMFKTGLRGQAVSNIKIEDIDGNKIRIIEKGNKEKFTYLDDNLLQTLSVYLAQRKTTSPYLFYGVRGKSYKLSDISINSRVKKCARKAGINKYITGHSTRRTAVTYVAIKYGKDVAQQFAGHVNRETTELYVNDEDQIVKNVLLG